MEASNVKAMREALIETQSAIARCMDILNKIPDTCGYGGLLDDAADELCALREMHLKSALSAPLRNCDNHTGWLTALKKFNDTEGKRKPWGDDVYDTRFLDWLFATPKQ